MQTDNELGVVIKNVVALRAEPNTESEQVSQALLGQPVWVEKRVEDYLYVRSWDGYHGLIANHAVRMLDETRPYASVGPVAVISDLFVDMLEAPLEGAPIVTKATMGMILEVAHRDGEWVELKLPDSRSAFIRSMQAQLTDANALEPDSLPDYEQLIKLGKRLIGVPYLWGGTSPFGIDCSGFVQLLHHMFRVHLLRDAHMQADDARCVPVEKRDLRAGDLVFFGRGKDPDLTKITHVGLAMSNKQFIHSCGSSGVIISEFDEPYYHEIYWGARRMRSATLDGMLWSED